MKPPDWLLDYKDNIYSQTGEDGIIKRILEILPVTDKWCVEFGAWDGVFLSNVRNLIERKGYSGILIEGSESRYHKLYNMYSNNKNIITVNAFVGFSASDNLDVILKDTPIPEDFDFLSIDVDGNDYHLWKAVSKYSPKAVCIEFNPTIPTEIKFIQPADLSVNQGASILALVELGKEKGYELISVLPFNAFFVKSQYFSLFEIEDNTVTTLRKSLDCITYMFSGYDGTMILTGSQELPWHGIKIKQSRIQQLPKVLRKYPGIYSKKEKLLFILYKLYTNPIVTVKKIISRIKK